MADRGALLMGGNQVIIRKAWLWTIVGNMLGGGHDPYKLKTSFFWGRFRKKSRGICHHYKRLNCFVPTQFSILFQWKSKVVDVVEPSLLYLNNQSTILIPVNPPPFRGSLPRKILNSRMDWVSCRGDINLPHTPFPPARYPPNKKSSTIKSWPTFCDQYFWKFPIWNSRADEKRREIRMVKVFKWYPVIDLFDTFTGKLGHGD